MRVPDAGILLVDLAGGRGRREAADPLEVMNDDRVKIAEDVEAARPSVLVPAELVNGLSREVTFGLEVLRPKVRELPETADGLCGPVLFSVLPTRGIGFGDCTPLVTDSFALKSGEFTVSGTRRAPPRRPVVAKLFALLGEGFEDVDTDSRLPF